MHAMGLHSALAIKRQRRRREEQRKARERRFSSQSTESGLGESRSSCASPRNSMGSLERKKHRHYRSVRPAQSDKVVSSVGMLHIGVIFLVLGLFLMGSGFIPDDFDNWQNSFTWFNELILSGLASLLVGIFLIILNKVIMRKEEKDLAEYVSRQLTRSRSGHRLVRDVETGNLVTKQSGKIRSEERMNILESEINGEITPVHFSPTLKSPPALSVSTPRSDLERILEEELSDKGDDRFHREHANSFTTHPQELSKELIASRYYNNLDINEK
ncbi:unnamed protein product [Nezara viridula]|uniref:Uncharacterized protein n=1 Tax=Nezara viridula TaxID=85310 RepID=A0A9P0H9E5_NEZVI|nr:unnamed protein product [Nezara viridula]